MPAPSARGAPLWSVAVALLLLLHGVGGIRHFNDLLITPTQPLIDREVLYTAEDAPGFGSNKSLLTVDIEYKLEDPASVPVNGLSVIVYFYEQLSAVSVSRTVEGQIYVDFCCSSAVQSEYGITCPFGGAIASNMTGVWVYNPMPDSFFRVSIVPPQSGVYRVVAVSCPDSGLGNVRLTSAYVIAENPYGFLPGDIYPLYPFYGSMAAAYLIVAAVWSYLCYQHMDHLLMLQHCITAVIFLNMLESATWYFNYLTWNHHGNMVTMGYVGGIAMSTLKRTFCRLLLLLAAMGFSVTKGNLGNTQYRVMVLGVVYFICSALQMSLEMARKASNGMNEAVTNAEGVFAIPASILELVFWWWTFLSLLATLAQVRMRGQVAKEALYRKFLYCLVFAAVVSFGVLMIEVFVVGGNDEYWPIMWLFDSGFWDGLNFAVLVYLAHLWHPSADSSAYAYGELHEQELSIVPSTIAADQVILRREQRAPGGPAPALVVPLEKDELIEALTSFAMDDEEKQAMDDPKNAKIE